VTETDNPSIDMTAVARGALVALVIAVPAVIAYNALAPGAGRSLAYIATIAGFGVGGYVAGTDQPRRGLSHGGLTGLAAGLVVILVGAVRRSAMGEPVAWSSQPFLALLASSSGAIGGYVAFRRSITSVEEEQST
jgi:putative membrane protein (TIGR04086 family)